MKETIQKFKALGGANWVVDGMFQAGNAIQDWISKNSLNARNKEDGSPVSDADLLSEQILKDWIGAKSPWPIVSEETTPPEKVGDIFWLIDPLDGTREFINGIPEYTINVALVFNRRPVFGAILEPSSGKLWHTVKGEGLQRVHPHAVQAKTSDQLRLAVSRYHGDPKLAALFPDAKLIQRGSAGKFALLADGEADLYVRIGRTMEWDTAAGHCLLEETGCQLVTLADQSEFLYKKPAFENPSFIACGGGVLEKVTNKLGRIG